MVDNEDIHSKMHKFRYLNIESIHEGFMLTPYLIIALLNSSGIIVLIFILNGIYGFIVFGIFLGFFVILVVILFYTYDGLIVIDK